MGYLFGPGVIDHIPNLGFGQMGMGDYDKRISAFCKGFVEEQGEDELRQAWLRDRVISSVELCADECKSSASGATKPSSRKRSPRRRMQPVAPKPVPKRKPTRKQPVSSRKASTPKVVPASSETKAVKSVSTEGHAASVLNRAKQMLPLLSIDELRILGQA